jgi:hypothetical protein
VGLLSFIAEVQRELERHNWDTFVDGPPSVAEGGKGVVVPGCVVCKKRINTTNRFLHHLVREVLPRAMQAALEREKAGQSEM